MEPLIVLSILAGIIGIIAGIVTVADYVQKQLKNRQLAIQLPIATRSIPVEADSSGIPKTALVVVAHPDDAEIGCGGLIARLVEDNWSIHVVTVSDGSATEEISPNIREEEQILGLKELGISKDSIHFLRNRDSAFSVDKILVGKIRSFITEYKPALIITHSQHDNHQDHVNVYRAVSAAVRSVPILSCFIPTSTRISEFSPLVYTSYLPYIGRKAAALAAHKSQITRGTFTVERIFQSNRMLCGYAGLTLAEAFEVQLPPASTTWPTILTDLNDAVLPRFWNILSEGKPIAIIFPDAPARRIAIDIITSKNSFIGGSQLAMRLQTLPGYKGHIVLTDCHDPQLPRYYQTHCCVYIAGRIPNTEAKKLYEKIQNQLVHKFERKSLNTLSWIASRGKEYRAKLSQNDVEIDYGIITAGWTMKPGFEPQSFVWAAGISGYGTLAAVQSLVSEAKISEMLSKLNHTMTGFQVLVRSEPKTQFVELLLDTFQPINFLK